MINLSSNTIYIRDTNTQITYYFNAVEELSPSLTSEVADYTTTDGTKIADHGYPTPATLTVTILESELLKTNNVYYIDSNNQQIRLTLNEIKNLLNMWRINFTRLIVQSRNAQFPNMVITGLNWREDNSNKGIFNPTITLKEVRIAKIQTAMLGPFASVSEQASNSPNSDMGEKNGVTVADSLGTIAAYTAVGAAIGTIIPGVGTAAGAGVGAIAGCVVSFGAAIGWW